jgi:hypothetical protein
MNMEKTLFSGISLCGIEPALAKPVVATEGNCLLGGERVFLLRERRRRLMLCNLP